MTPSEAPKALQASECSELLDPMRASCWISAQHWPGKFIQKHIRENAFTCPKCLRRFSKREKYEASVIGACAESTVGKNAICRKSRFEKTPFARFDKNNLQKRGLETTAPRKWFAFASVGNFLESRRELLKLPKRIPATTIRCVWPFARI